MKCRACTNEVEFTVQGGIAWCAKCGQYMGKWHGQTAKERMNEGSKLEELFIAQWTLLAPPTIAPPEREVKLIPERPRSRCDFVWLDAKVVVEVDGGQFAPRGGRHNTDADRWKINRLVELGFAVLRYSGEMIKGDPQRVIDQVANLIMKRMTTKW